MSKRVVVGGASGFIGHALVEHLRAREYEVITVDRRAQPGGFAWSGSWQAQLEGTAAVINLAGAPITLPWTPPNLQLIISSRLDSAKAVADAILKAVNPPDVWINASAVGFYGDRGDEVLTEQSAVGKGFLAEITQQWEAAIFATDVSVRKVAVRTGVALGPKGGALTPLAKLAKFGLGGHLGDGRQWMSWIDLRDLCALYERAIESDWQGSVNAVSPKPIQNREFMRTLREVSHRPWAPPTPRFLLDITSKLGAPDSSVLLDSVRALPDYVLKSGFPFEHVELRDVLKAAISD
jgi:uncharacterized protein